VLAYTYPVLDAFVTILWFFLWVIWLVLVFRIIFDIFRSHDIGGLAKALWLLFVLVLPFLGVLVYLIVRGGKMHERDVRMARTQDEALRAYVRDAAGTSQTDELAKLASLKDSGALSDEEFQRGKARILGQ
jgi:Short C-terminal domain/Phospholipase_D-nuclease N-terminal